MAAEGWEALRRVPIQAGGRVKPLDSFARETVRTLVGASAYRGQDPLRTVMAIAAEPSAWESVPLLAVPYRPLCERLGMAPTVAAISSAQIFSERKLMPLLPPLVAKQQSHEPLTPLDQEVSDLYQRMLAFHELTTGEAFRVMPSPPAGDGVWRAPTAGSPSAEAWRALVAAARDPNDSALVEAVTRWRAASMAGRSAAWPLAWRLDLEVRYNEVQPFRVAWLGYGLAALLIALGFHWPVGRRLGLSILGLTLVLHVAGLATRIVLANRPPVSNLYESMLWLACVLVVLALGFERATRLGYAALAAAVMGGITLVLADQLPFEPGIHPVIAVLRSPLWLTIHVLTIVASYAALTLATGVAHVAAGLYLARRPAAALANALQLLYRIIQIGVILLAAGVMLGALWANASWGRYWGWDPKETWALITLLWFIAILHGRFAGWIRGVGLAVATIGGFLLLLMTYYGVNYFLVGLHSYAGGHATRPWPPLLVTYLVVEGLFVGLVALAARHRARHVSQADA